MFIHVNVNIYGKFKYKIYRIAYHNERDMQIDIKYPK